MAQLAQQRAWMANLQQRIHQVVPRWRRNGVTTMGITGSKSRPSARLMQRRPADVAPELLARMQDNELLVLIGQGDCQALGALYDRYGSLVFSIALHITGLQIGAEAVTQDVFLSVWQHVHAFQGIVEPVTPWLVAMARRFALAKIDGQRTPSRIPDAPLDLPGSTMLQTGPRCEQGAGLRDDVHAALAALPKEQLRALELASAAGLTTPEIAAVLGTAEGMVKAQLSLGLVALRDALRPSLKLGQQTVHGEHGPATSIQSRTSR
jgi:RNA polymerase sigma-70 factor (ECF subfamily)